MIPTRFIRAWPAAAAVVAMALMAALPAQAAPRVFTGTRSNISPGGVSDGRCAPAITVSFAPGNFSANGTSNLGNFSYTASHCIAGPPPGNYFDGQFSWDMGNGSLTGTYTGELGLLSPGVFSVTEQILFTGGTGRYLGATGSALLTGQLSFGTFEGGFASFSNGDFAGMLDAPGVPEPASWALLIAGFGLAGAMQRRQRAIAA